MSESDQSEKPRPRTAWEEAEAEGMDMSLIEDNLRKSPLERIREHDRALKLRKAMQERNEQP
jgi:hypothetical protein